VHWAASFWLGVIIAIEWGLGLLAFYHKLFLIGLEALLIRQLIRPHPTLIFPIPLWVVMPLFMVIDWVLSKFPLLKLPIGADALIMLEEDNIGDVTELEKILNITPTPFISQPQPSSFKHPLHRSLKKIYA
jgi:hypothetical protein